MYGRKRWNNWGLALSLYVSSTALIVDCLEITILQGISIYRASQLEVLYAVYAHGKWAWH
jgi:hypothetical protein